MSNLKLLQKDANTISNYTSRPGQRLHHISKRATGVIHKIEILGIAIHTLQKERHSLLDWKASKRVFIAHNKQLTEFGERRELHTLVGLLQRGDELLRVWTHTRRHGSVQKLLYFRSERVYDVRWQSARL
jgi:hypothetical protein